MFSTSCLQPLARTARSPSSHFSTSSARLLLSKLTRVRVVDNSELGKQTVLAGKPAKVIDVYTKRKPRIGALGDLVMIAVMGQKKKAVVVGSKQYLKIPMVPDFDTHNVVLLNNDYTPIGKRILAPVPHMLREKGQYAKVIAIATKFV